MPLIMVILALIILSFAFGQIPDSEKEMLLAVHVIRHGLRTPKHMDEKYLWNVTWERLPGEITPSGEHQMFLYG